MRALAVILGLVLTLAVLVVGAETLTRRTVDDTVAATVSRYLVAASSDGQGFATVHAHTTGRALPALAQRRVSGISAVATDGEVAGLRVDRLDMSSGPIDLRTRQASDVRVTATLGEAALASVVATSGGVPGATVTAASPDTLRVAAPYAGADLVLDLQLSAEGGGVTGRAVAATVSGQSVDPAQVLAGPAVLLPADSLPSGLAAAGATVSGAADGTDPVVTLVLECPSGCSLNAG